MLSHKNPKTNQHSNQRHLRTPHLGFGEAHIHTFWSNIHQIVQGIKTSLLRLEFKVLESIYQLELNQWSKREELKQEEAQEK